MATITPTGARPEATATPLLAIRTGTKLADIVAAIDATATSTIGGPNPTIDPYTTNLNGIDQISNKRYQDVLFWFLGIIGFIVLLVRTLELLEGWVRNILAMGQPAEKQLYWKMNHGSWRPWIKKHITYAPLWNKRHNREFRLSSAVNIGTLPSRFHTVLLSALLISNVAYCAALDYSVENKWAIMAQLRGRSGVLSLANMVPLIIFAGRNNPLISLLKVSFDTYNLLHRWIGRIVVLEAVIHTLAWAITQVAAGGWKSVGHKIVNDPFIGWGMVATVAMVVILMQSPSIFRHAFYETFLNVHIILAFLAIVGVWIHCALADLPQLPYARGVFWLWVLERTIRLCRMIYHNISFSKMHYTTTTVIALPGDVCRVTLHLPKYVDVKPGSHAYLRFWVAKPWESHPFSIAWTQHQSFGLPHTEKDLDTDKKFKDYADMKTSVSFLIAAQTGFTKTLYNRALKCNENRLITKAVFEGPYAGHHDLTSYGHMVLFAGSTGITHQLTHVRHFLEQYQLGTIATRRLTLIWIVRDLEHLEWIRPWMETVLRMEKRRELVRVKLFITRPKKPTEVVSPSSTVQMLPGRPDVRKILEDEVADQKGAMCVTVCGPGSLADNVRQVVREVQDRSHVDFIEESFTW
jgi:hypothetical protein